jgi:hypothetical protein
MDAFVNYSSAMYNAQSRGNGNLLQAVNDSASKATLVVTANSIFENASSVPALKKQAAVGTRVVVWALNGVEELKLQMLEINAFAEIVVASDTGALTAALEKRGIKAGEAGLVNAGQDLKVEGVFGDKVTLQKPGEQAVNNMPLTYARSVAAAQKGNAEVVKQFNRMADNYASSMVSENDQDRAAKLEALKNLESKVFAMPAMESGSNEAQTQVKYDKAIIEIDSVANEV